MEPAFKTSTRDKPLSNRWLLVVRFQASSQAITKQSDLAQRKEADLTHLLSKNVQHNRHNKKWRGFKRNKMNIKTWYTKVIIKETLSKKLLLSISPKTQIRVHKIGTRKPVALAASKEQTIKHKEVNSKTTLWKDFLI